MGNPDRLSIPAQAYIVMVIAAGGALLGLVPLQHLGSFNLPNLAILGGACAVAAMAQVVKVEGSTAKTSYNLSLLVYGFTLVLLGPGPAVLVAVFACLIDWAWNRYPWFIQAFNICCLIANLCVAGLVFRGVLGAAPTLSWRGALALIAAAMTFVILNHVMVGLAIVFARGESFAQSGVFGKISLLMDATLFASGSLAGLLWLSSPYLVPVLLIPIYMLSATLRVPSLERQVVLDAKTGLHNARYFHEALDRELARANRFDRPLCVIVADLDLLRSINNAYGHLTGDAVLTGIARIFKENFREHDIVARFGGEEFSILMPDTLLADAVPRVERLRRIIEATYFESSALVEPVKATMSFGIAQRIYDQNAQEILHRADLALYQAKAEGRNRVRVALDRGSLDWVQGDSYLEGLEAEEGDSTAYRVMILGTEASGPAGIATIVNPVAAMDRSPAAHTVAESSLVAGSSVAGSTSVAHGTTTNGSRGSGFPGWRVAAVASAVILAATAAFWLSLSALGSFDLDWYKLGLLAAIAVLTELLSVEIYVRETSVSTSAAPFVAAAVLFGPIGVLVMSIAMAGPAMIKHRSSPLRFFFNTGSHLLAGLGTVWLVHVTPIPAEGWSHWLQFALSIVGAGLLFGTTTTLVSAVLSFTSKEQVSTIWKEKFSWLALYYLGLGIVAAAIVLGYEYLGYLGVVLALAPLFILRWAQKEYVTRTKDLVAALRESNETLMVRAAEVTELNEGLLGALAKAVELRDPFVLGHSQNVARYAVLLGCELRLPEERIEIIRKAALLHDIGKVGIEDHILFKPGRLTPDEYEAVKAHPEMATEVLGACRCLETIAAIVLHHHERYDGRGYPNGLTGLTIPLESRILAVADALEAITSGRPYRAGSAADAALKEIRDNVGRQFDPEVVAALISVASREDESLIVDSAAQVQPRRGAVDESGRPAAARPSTVGPELGTDPAFLPATR